MFNLRGLSLFCLMFIASHAIAQNKVTIYKWVDEKGQVHFSQQPSQPDAKAIDIRLPPNAKKEREVAAKQAPQEQPTKQRVSDEDCSFLIDMYEGAKRNYVLATTESRKKDALKYVKRYEAGIAQFGCQKRETSQ
ncbi:hypothetical protein C2869_17835 [Saccharobesus litoralis]|uniref:DUF4124 domain-containing protein n=1 Tax=Saccharobesus litoralis TaxID=2172099 RepID=A0A2S0VVM5_9ALTE|nr:DUF4124 domain-containing protein [Saccharobesus litoralis]AWB68160.1 hypothetical protein C2869_17835 [Saccharobesus litoralis]